MSEFLLLWKRYFTFAALLSCFVNFLQLTFPFYMFTIYRNIVVSYSPYSLMSITVAAMFALTVFGLFYFVRSRLLFYAGKSLNEKLMEKVYSGILRSHSAVGNRTYVQGINDISVLREFFSNNTLNSVFDVPWSPFYLILLFFIHPGLGVISLLGTFIVIGLSFIQEKLIREKMAEANKINSTNQRFITSFMNNIEVINGMGMSNSVSDWFEDGNKKVIINQTRSSFYAGAVQAAIKPLQNIIQVLIYCFGAYFAITQGFSVGLMVAASIIMGRALGPVMQVSAAWRMTHQAREAFERLKNFNAFLDSHPKRMPLPEPDGNFDVSQMSFSKGGPLILYNLNFKIQSGDFLGIIGPSGAGKTTLCRLLLGLWPATVGSVRLDGLDVFKWDREISGGVTGYLPQEIELFEGTVAENIARLGTPDPKKIKEAVDICGIGELVESFPNGLDTMLEGESGLRLSGGQKQIIGMARAVYGFPKILILDEPTSNLDEKAELLIMNVLKKLKEINKTTCIMVTHKMSMLQSVDNILVLNSGVITAYGKRDEVFAKLAANTNKAGGNA